MESATENKWAIGQQKEKKANSEVEGRLQTVFIMTEPMFLPSPAVYMFEAAKSDWSTCKNCQGQIVGGSPRLIRQQRGKDGTFTTMFYKHLDCLTSRAAKELLKRYGKFELVPMGKGITPAERDHIIFRLKCISEK